MSTHKIPTLAELHAGNPDAFANDRLKTLLNTPPNQAWLKKHPMTGNPYMPVDKVEYLLDCIYGRWEVVVKNIFQIENSVAAIVTLKVWNPHRNDWDYQDGGGAAPIQVESSCKASDMLQIKSNAIQLAVPAAISYAKKDAADNYGKIFGRDVTRKDTLAFNPSFKEDPYVSEPLANGEQAPPPPPPLPPSIAEKVITKVSYGPTPEPVYPTMADYVADKPQPAPTPTAPPPLPVNAFAAPAAAQAPSAVQLPDLDTKIDF